MNVVFVVHLCNTISRCKQTEQLYEMARAVTLKELIILFIHLNHLNLVSMLNFV